MELYEYPIMQKRLIQFLRIGQAAYLLVLISKLIQHSLTGEPWVFTPDMIRHLLIMAFPEYVVYLIKQKRVRFAVNLFLTVRISFLLLAIWSESGLQSAVLVVMPWVLFLATVYTCKRNHLIYVFMLFTGVIAIGLNDIYQWANSDVVQIVDDKVRMAQLIIIYLASGFMSWSVAQDLRFVYNEKVKEQANLLEVNQKMQRLAETDKLTSLSNRNGARRKFELLRSSTDYSKEALLVLFVDVNDFKSINNQYSHTMGDQLLRLIGARLANAVGESSMVARLCSDEFVIITKQNADFDTSTYVEFIVTELARPYHFNDVELTLSSSMGIATSVDAKQSFDDLCGMAGIALYQAKAEGKNSYHYYHDDLRKEYVTNVRILKGMQDALESNVLSLSYQTKLDTRTGEVVGVEALLRWVKNNPQKYTVSQILPVIENTCLIHEIGNWVLKEACSACKTWQDNGSLIPVSVNVSARQLMDQRFSKNLAVILEETGLPAASLTLEIIEGSLIKEGSEVVAQLREVKALGVKLSIDGFGAGYSSMTYLADLDVDELKMDKSFVASISSEKTQLVVEAFVKMANKLGIQLVAHGIETEKDHKIFQSLGCKIGQGFLWTKPVSVQFLPSLLR